MSASTMTRLRTTPWSQGARPTTLDTPAPQPALAPADLPGAPTHYTPLPYAEAVEIHGDWLSSLKGTFLDAARSTGMEIRNLKVKRRFLGDQTLRADLYGTHAQHVAFERLWQMAERGEWGRW